MRRIRSTGWDAHGTERLTIGREEYVWCANGHLLRFSSSDWAMLGVATDRTDAEARIEADLNARAARILTGAER